ncbi:uncharacterized protein SOCE836_052660 [Sorangium cellulosum]|uniref:Cation efflux protein transmembrane domain-containing protein n=1 Tax=Sorangium cellulosum TaxID=56 RepID=A0A4P2QUA8_SORCE|nr:MULTISPECIES: cation transporter [Sorangium]AUX33113.1 uncharacterized protein SOCE836_052660 [Sorangium cellulosum]WCQ92487.1 hypothetical protein NQZ70_05228 [Sorangium sp. Soce836]
MERESRIAIFGAIAANVAIAAVKFIAAAVTGSSATLSEGVHSLVDTADGLLHLLGVMRIEFDAALTASGVAEAIERIETRIRSERPDVKCR